jgi:hypothetical protein
MARTDPDQGRKSCPSLSRQEEARAKPAKPTAAGKRSNFKQHLRAFASSRILAATRAGLATEMI